MTISVLNDIILPSSLIEAGVSGKRQRSNQRAEVNGYVSVNRGWSRSRRQYSWGSVPLTVEQMDTMVGLFEAVDADQYGFLMEDPTDSVIAAGSGLLYGYVLGQPAGVAGTGHGVPTYQVNKRYGVAGSSRSHLSRITRPRAGLALQRAGSPVTLGVAAGNAAINYDTGVVTFVPDAAQNVSSVSVGATTQVVLAAPLAGLLTGTGRLWLQGLTGADAALLNLQSHPITSIAGSTYTLGVNTTGKTITAAGQGHKYPQPTEALTANGRFYVPVHFNEQELDWDIVTAGPAATRLFACPSITLQEVRE